MGFPLVETPYGVIEGQVVDNQLAIHFKYSGGKFTPGSYKDLLRIWDTFLESLHLSGVPEIFTIIPKSDKKTCKFQTMFGFEPVHEQDGVIVYRMDTSWEHC